MSEVEGAKAVSSADASSQNRDKPSLGVVITPGSALAREVANSFGCVRSLGRLSRALSLEDLELVVSVISWSEATQATLVEKLGSIASKGRHRVLTPDANASKVLVGVVEDMSTSHILIMNHAAVLSYEWIGSIARHLSRLAENEVLFPSQHLQYGDTFQAVDYSGATRDAFLSAASPFTELLPPMAIISQVDAAKILSDLDTPSWERAKALYQYQIQQGLLRAAPFAAFSLLPGSTFDRAPKTPEGALSTAWWAGVGIGAPTSMGGSEQHPDLTLSWLLDAAGDDLQSLAITGGSGDQALPPSLLESVQAAAQFDPRLLLDLPEKVRIRAVRPSALLGAAAEHIAATRPSDVRVVALRASRLYAGNGGDLLIRLISTLQRREATTSVIITEGLIDRAISRPADRVFVFDAEAFLKDESSEQDFRAFFVWILTRFKASLLNQGIDFIDDTLLRLEAVLPDLHSGSRVRYFPSSQLLPGSVAIDFSGSPDADRKAIELLQAGVYDMYTSTHHWGRSAFVSSFERTGTWREPTLEGESELSVLMRLTESMQ